MNAHYDVKEKQEVASQVANTREVILDAATEVMSNLGLARATTKEIARGPDCRKNPPVETPSPQQPAARSGDASASPSSPAARSRRPHSTSSADLQQAEAALDQARQQLLKARQPYTAYDLQQQEQAVNQPQALLDKASSPYTEQDLAAAQAAVDQARAALDLAELGLAETTVVAPVNGIIAGCHGQSADAAGDACATRGVELVVNVDEGQLGRIREGQSVQLEVPAFIGQAFTGVANSIAPTLDPRSRTAAVRVEPRDDDQQLRAGMFARLSIVTAKREGVLLVPRDAVIAGAVFAVEAGTVHRVPVTVGLDNGPLLEIASGIDEGDVATSAVNDLADGDEVRLS